MLCSRHGNRQCGTPDGSKLAPLLHERVHEAEAEEHALEGVGARAALEELAVLADGVERVAAAEVGTQARGWLVGHLDRVLQHADGEGGAGHGRHPEAEVGVRGGGRDALADFLQRRHPRRREVAVLQRAAPCVASRGILTSGMRVFVSIRTNAPAASARKKLPRTARGRGACAAQGNIPAAAPSCRRRGPPQ